MKKETGYIYASTHDGVKALEHELYDFGEKTARVGQFGTKWFIFDINTGRTVGDGRDTRKEAVLMFQTTWFYDYMRMRKSAYYDRQVKQFQKLKRKERKT